MSGKSKKLWKSKQTSWSDDLQLFGLWIVGFCFTSFFLIAPFAKALFNGGARNNLSAYIFNQPIYTAMMFLFLFACVFGLFLFARNNLRLLFERNMIPIVLATLIPASYLLTLLDSPASWSHTMQSIVIHCMYVYSFLMAVFMSRLRQGATFLTGVIMGSGYIVVIFGLLNWLTGPFYQDAVLMEPGRLRLTSVFQYANTYAVFLTALLLASLYILIRTSDMLHTQSSRSKPSTRMIRLARTAAAWMIVPSCLSMILTSSRGGLVILPVVVFILLFLLKFRQQLLLVLYLTAAGLISAIATPYMTKVGMRQYESFDPEAFITGALVIIAASAAFVLIVHFKKRAEVSKINRFWARIEQLRLSRLMIPISCALLGAVIAFLLFKTNLVTLLPEDLRQRISSINFEQHSVLERAAFYRDAMKIVKDYPVFGTGGNGWSLLYERYQQNPYVSTQAHSFYIQQLIETGWFGFLVFITFIAFVYWRFVRYYVYREREDNKSFATIFFLFPTAILLHSMIDFDMSYVYIGCLVFICLGGMLGTANAPFTHEPSNPKRFRIRRWLIPLFAVLCAVLLFITSVRFMAAGNHYVMALQQAKTGKLDDVLTPLDHAIRLFPHADYLGYRAALMLDVYRQTDNDQFAQQFLDTVEQIKRREPYYQFALDKLLSYYLYTNRHDDAIATLERWMEIAPWNIHLYESAIALHVQLGSRAPDAEEQDRLYAKAMSYYGNVLDRIKALDELPAQQLPGRTFAVSPNMAFIISQVHLSRGEYGEASELLTPFIQDNPSAQYRDLVRLYLVSKMLQQEQDDALYSSFTEQYPDEIERIHQLVLLYKHQNAAF